MENIEANSCKKAYEILVLLFMRRSFTTIFENEMQNLMPTFGKKNDTKLAVLKNTEFYVHLLI